MDGLFGSDAGAAIVGGVLILLMILGVLLAADRKTREMILEQKMEETVSISTPIQEESPTPSIVAPMPSQIRLTPTTNIPRPLMSNELPTATSVETKIENNLANSSSNISMEKWTDEQLLSAGWSIHQIESLRSKSVNLEEEIEDLSQSSQVVKEDQNEQVINIEEEEDWDAEW